MRQGVLLLNLGGPETLGDVRPFLYNLFSDPEIIRIRCGLPRRLLAWAISRARQGKSRDLYRQIGGGSPLRRITEEQAAALEARLASGGAPARVYVGMRFGRPGIGEALGRIAADGVDRLVLLPLFPQYSLATTGSCLKFFDSLSREDKSSGEDSLLGEDKSSGEGGPGGGLDVRTVQWWYDEPLYVEAMAETVERALARFSPAQRPSVHLVYSAHSIPLRYVAEGDPYLEQTRLTVALVNERLGASLPWTLAFQSRVGPVRWLGPSTRDVLADLGGRGTGSVLVVPVSFVSDHIETLQEIDIAYRAEALRVGIRRFERAEALNLLPKFIDALAAVASRHLA